LQNGLGGVAVNSLGFDDGYSELWDELTYKFTTIDTVYLTDSIIPQKKELTFLKR